MRFRYFSGTASGPLPSRGGSRVRYRPVIPIRITGPSQFVLHDCLLDTGADDVVFPTTFAPIIGIDLSQAPQRMIGLAGRGAVVCRYASVKLWLSDGAGETYDWNATVGFVPVPFRNALLGHAGFLQFFNAEFRGQDREVILTTNPSFPGRRV